MSVDRRTQARRRGLCINSLPRGDVQRTSARRRPFVRMIELLTGSALVNRVFSNGNQHPCRRRQSWRQAVAPKSASQAIAGLNPVPKKGWKGGVVCGHAIGWAPFPAPQRHSRPAHSRTIGPRQARKKESSVEPSHHTSPATTTHPSPSPIPHPPPPTIQPTLPVHGHTVTHDSNLARGPAEIGRALVRDQHRISRDRGVRGRTLR